MAVPAQHFRSVLVTRSPVHRGVDAVPEPHEGHRGRLAAAHVRGRGRGARRPRPRPIGVLSGPNIAREVVAGQPAATVVALPDARPASRLQQALMRPTLRVYTNPDVVGCEIGGAVKNVIALAAGMADGLGFGENTMAALVTRGLAELTRLGVALGGQPLTFLGLAGMGDLVVTCNSSRQSQPPRRRAARTGPAARRDPLGDDIGGRRRPLVRPGPGARPAAGVELPICEQVGQVLEGRAGPRRRWRRSSIVRRAPSSTASRDRASSTSAPLRR